MMITKNVLKILLKILLKIFIVLVSILVAAFAFISVYVISNSRLMHQSIGWDSYINDATDDYILEKADDIQKGSKNGTSGHHIFDPYVMCKIDLRYEYSFQKETAAEVVSEIKRIVCEADTIYGGNPSEITVRHTESEKHYDIVIKKPAKSWLDFA